MTGMLRDTLRDLVDEARAWKVRAVLGVVLIVWGATITDLPLLIVGSLLWLDGRIDTFTERRPADD